MTRNLTSAFVALLSLTLTLVACQSTPDNRATSGEASAAAPSGAAQPRSSADSRVASNNLYDLARDEQRGGHTLDKHVGRTDDQLRERLERERDISAASTWTDLTAAEETVAAALRANQVKIDRWNERGYPRTNLALHFDAGHPIGRTMHHAENSSEPCSGAVVVLKADRDGGFFVLTTYPEDRE
ncbi:MAG TPA: RNase A-like domain-containing protein [Candidatus Acidoferrum sp.]